MTKSRIDTCDETLNPIVGCSRGCAWCYARPWAKRNRMMIAGTWLRKHDPETSRSITHQDIAVRLEAYRNTPVWCEDCFTFKVHEHLERLEQITPRQSPKIYFIGSMCDINDKAVHYKWIQAIIAKMEECNQHIYQLLTERPKGYEGWEYPKHCWLGVTVRNQRETDRIYWLKKAAPDNVKYVYIEPLHGPIMTRAFANIDWVVIGAETGNRKGKVIPQSDWVTKIVLSVNSVNNLCGYSRNDIPPIFMKSNLARDAWKDKPLIQEWPKALNRKLPNRIYGDGARPKYFSGVRDGT